MRPTARIVVVLLTILVSVSGAAALTPVAVCVGKLAINVDNNDDAAVLSDDQIYLIHSNGDRTFSPFGQPTVSNGLSGGGGAAIATGSFNSDTAVDLAVTGGGATGQVSVLIGNGDGTFKSPKTNLVGDTPDAIVVADLNGDGRADIAVVNSQATDENVSLLYGNGNGTFKPSITTAETFSVGIAAADFDRDQLIDMVVSNESGGQGVTLLHNNPSCSEIDCENGWARRDIGASSVDAGSFGDSEAVLTGDLDADGKPDIVALGSGDPPALGILMNTTAAGAKIGFKVSSVDVTNFPLDVQDGPGLIALADVNNDGRPDILAINDSNDGVYVFSNNGSGGFPNAPVLISPSGARHLIGIATGDFDHDGNVDIVLVDDAAETAIFLFGDGTGNFPIGIGNEVDFDVSGGVTNTPTDTPSTSETATVTPSPTGPSPTPTATFTPTATSTPTLVPVPYGACNTNDLKSLGSDYDLGLGSGHMPVAIGIGDFDNNGKPDFAVADEAKDQVVIVMSGLQSAPAPGPGVPKACSVLGLKAGATVEVTGPVALAVGTLHQSSNLDLAVAGSQGLSILAGDGAGGFIPTPPAALPTPTGAPGPALPPTSLAVADFNNNGRPDILVANGSSSLFLFLDGSLGTVCPIDLPGNATMVLAKDLNGDRQPDFIIANDQTNSVSVFLRNTQTPTPGAGTPHSVTPTPSCVTAADFSLAAQSQVDPRAIPRAILTVNDVNPEIAALLSWFPSSPEPTPTGTPTPGRLVTFANSAKPGQGVVYHKQGPLVVPTPDGGQIESAPSALASGDVSIPPDHLADLVVADRNNDDVVVFFGDAQGMFATSARPVPLREQQLGTPTPLMPVAIAMGDLDGDGTDDVITANAGDGSVSILLSAGRPATPTPPPTSTATATLTATATPLPSTPTITPPATRTRVPTLTPVPTGTATPRGVITLSGSCAVEPVRREADVNVLVVLGAGVVAAMRRWCKRRLSAGDRSED